MRRAVVIAFALLAGSGCMYQQEVRVKRATADLRYALAELITQYRTCLQRYEPTGRAAEACAGYQAAVRELSPQVVAAQAD
jgi:hypothetical protein